MRLLKELLGLFSDQLVVLEPLENEELLSLTGSSPALAVPGEAVLLDLLARFPARDQLKLQVVIGTSEPAVLTSDGHSVAGFIAGLEAALKLFPAEGVSYTLSVDKTMAGNLVSVYELPMFNAYLQGLDCGVLLRLFSGYLSGLDYVVFELLDESSDFQTASFFFSTAGRADFKGMALAERKALGLKSDGICHYGNSGEMVLFPADLALQVKSGLADLDKLFGGLAFMCCLIRLFDITGDLDLGLTYRLNGYKAISGEIALAAVALDTLPEYLKIADWVYSEGNLSDKIGLARNLISLHISDQHSLALSPYTFDSIRSGFDIYLKDNIKQYIDIRSKIQDQLLDFNKRASSIIDAFGSGFQKSALAVVTFFASVLVAKILSGGKIDEVFSFDAYLLTVVFLLVSLGYLVLSYQEVNSQIERFKLSYTHMRNRYLDLLTADDIDHILNNDAEQLDNVRYLEEKRKNYLTLWIFVLAVIFLVTTVLHVMYILDSPPVKH